MSSLDIRPVRSAQDWDGAALVREEVYVIEQACPPELEWDDFDEPSLRDKSVHHLVGRVGADPAAVLRWRVVPLDGAPAAKIERVAVRGAFRGRGFAREIVARGMADARAAGHERFTLHAQAHLAAFYASFGFEILGEPFEEAGIEHVKMTLTGE